MIIINLATIDFGGGGGSSKPLITEPLIANIWSRGRRIFTPANYNVDGFSDVTINTAIIGDNSALDFSIIGWDGEDSDYGNLALNADIEYSKEILDKWNSGEISTFNGNTKLRYAPKINSSNKTNMSFMFNNCISLTIVPLFDTSNVTDMSNMFYDCKLLTTIPLFDTSNVTDMSSMFYNCNKFKTLPAIDTSNVTNMSWAFSFTAIETIPLIDTTKVTSINNMFYYCDNLKTIPQLNLLNVKFMQNMFDNCKSLESISLLNVPNVTNISNLFGWNNFNSLTELGGFKDLKIDWNDNYGLVKCPNLTYQSVMNVLNNLYDFRANGDDTTTRTIKLHSNSYNLLSADDIAMANGMGWNITT